MTVMLCPARSLDLRQQLPRHATLSRRANRWRQSRDAATCLLDRNDGEFVNLGRQAIELALNRCGLREGENVLLPAFHCIPMVNAVLRAGGRPLFYGVTASAAPDIESIRTQIVKGARALIAPHFFGFPSPMSSIRALCNENGVILIEDCCHTIFGKADGVLVGSQGHYAVASPWKFLPMRRGACLWTNVATEGASFPKIPSAALSDSARDWLNAVEYAGQYGRASLVYRALTPIFALSRRRAGKRASHSQLEESNPRAAYPSREAPVRGLSQVGRYLMYMADRQRVVQKRREHYELLNRHLQGLPGIRPLHPGLPSDVVPQVFPLLVDAPETVSVAIMEKGIPIIRFGEFLWEGMPRGVCDNAERFSKHLLQLPCHQELYDCEVRYMAACIREVVAGGG